MKHDRRYRAGINFARSPELSDFIKSYALNRGWEFAWVDRTREPEEVMGVDGRSIPWKVEELLKACRGKIPKIFYESPGWEKEPFSYYWERTRFRSPLRRLKYLRPG